MLSGPRLLLLKWYDRPTSLEEFLVPNLFNWTVPEHPSFTNPDQLRKRHPKFQIPRTDRQLHIVNNRSSKVWLVPGSKEFDKFSKNYPLIWYSFFQPSSKLQVSLDETYSQLNLRPGQYDAVHCRVRHPAHTNSLRRGEADLNGLVFEGDTKRNAIITAVHAIQCSNWIAGQHLVPSSSSYSNNNTNHHFDDKDDDNITTTTIIREPVYFYSDSDDLVREIITLQNGISNTTTTTTTTTTTHDEMMISDIGGRQIVGRINATSAHIDQPNQTLDSYMNSFIDLYVAMNARCISVGVGNFAYFASKISNIECLTVHEIPDVKVATRWGSNAYKTIESCPIPTIMTTTASEQQQQQEKEEEEEEKEEK